MGKKKIRVYAVKVRVSNKDNRVKMSPRFLEGVIIATDKKSAEDIAISRLMLSTSDSGVYFEPFRTVALKTDFLFSKSEND